MKNRLIKLVLLVAASAGSASCLGDMDIIQKSKITTSNMWIDEGDAKAPSTACTISSAQRSKQP